jgi:hypothetical protein
MGVFQFAHKGALPKQRCDMMLTLGVINVNPAGASAITWFGVIILALLAVVVVGLWLVVARQLARNRDNDPDSDDPGLDALRRQRLIVRRPRGRQATVVAELEPDSPGDQGAHPESGQ